MAILIEALTVPGKNQPALFDAGCSGWRGGDQINRSGLSSRCPEFSQFLSSHQESIY